MLKRLSKKIPNLALDKKHLGFLLLFISLLILICVINTCSGDRPHHSVKHSKDVIHSAAISDDGKHVLILGPNQAPALWYFNQKNKTTANPSTKFQGLSAKPIKVITLSPNGKVVAMGDNQLLLMRDSQSGDLISGWTYELPVHVLLLSLNGGRLLVGKEPDSLYSIDTKTGKTTQIKHADNAKISSVSLSRDGQFIMTAAEDRSAKMWQADDGKLIHTWSHQEPVIAVTISPQNQYAASIDKFGTINIWSIKDGKLLKAIQSEPMQVNIAKFSPSEKYLVLGSPPQMVRIWDVLSGKQVQEFHLPKKNFWQPTWANLLAIAFSPDEKFIITTDSWGQTHYWLLQVADRKK